jgi:hypothetical protein
MVEEHSHVKQLSLIRVCKIGLILGEPAVAELWMAASQADGLTAVSACPPRQAVALEGLRACTLLATCTCCHLKIN